jgi:DNA-binding NarL/FixJ family response regulator
MPRSRRSSPAIRAAPTLAPRGMRAAKFRFGDEDLAVLSFPLPEVVLPESLTDAEREIARALLDGSSNAEIAEARGTSARTVANQIASLFRKMKVQSRGELFVMIARRGSP